VVDAKRRLVASPEDLRNARLSFKDLARLFFKHAVIEVNMGDLMIGHGEHFTCATVEHLPAQFILDRQPALLPEKTVEMDWPVNLGDAIFGQDQHLNGLSREKVDQIAHDLIDCFQILRNRRVAGAKTLEIIIQVRQID